MIKISYVFLLSVAFASNNGRSFAAGADSAMTQARTKLINALDLSNANIRTKTTAITQVITKHNKKELLESNEQYGVENSQHGTSYNRDAFQYAATKADDYKTLYLLNSIVGEVGTIDLCSYGLWQNINYGDKVSSEQLFEGMKKRPQETITMLTENRAFNGTHAAPCTLIEYASGLTDRGDLKKLIEILKQELAEAQETVRESSLSPETFTAAILAQDRTALLNFISNKTFDVLKTFMMQKQFSSEGVLNKQTIVNYLVSLDKLSGNGGNKNLTFFINQFLETKNIEAYKAIFYVLLEHAGQIPNSIFKLLFDNDRNTIAMKTLYEIILYSKWIPSKQNTKILQNLLNYTTTNRHSKLQLICQLLLKEALDISENAPNKTAKDARIKEVVQLMPAEAYNKKNQAEAVFGEESQWVQYTPFDYALTKGVPTIKRLIDAIGESGELLTCRYMLKACLDSAKEKEMLTKDALNALIKRPDIAKQVLLESSNVFGDRPNTLQRPLDAYTYQEPTKAQQKIWRLLKAATDNVSNSRVPIVDPQDSSQKQNLLEGKAFDAIQSAFTLKQGKSIDQSNFKKAVAFISEKCNATIDTQSR